MRWPWGIVALLLVISFAHANSAIWPRRAAGNGNGYIEDFEDGLNDCNDLATVTSVAGSDYDCDCSAGQCPISDSYSMMIDANQGNNPVVDMDNSLTGCSDGGDTTIQFQMNIDYDNDSGQNKPIYLRDGNTDEGPYLMVLTHLNKWRADGCSGGAHGGNSTATYSLDTDYTITMKYTCGTAATNDVLEVWADPPDDPNGAASSTCTGVANGVTTVDGISWRHGDLNDLIYIIDNFNEL